MNKKLMAAVLVSAMTAGTLFGAAPAMADGEETTQGTNTFVDGGTDMNFWTFQSLHVGFWTTMADEWNKENPDRAINLTVTTGDSASIHSKLLVACQSGDGAPDMADIEIGHYGAFLKDGYLVPIDDAVEPYRNDVVMSRINMYGDGEHVYGADFHLGASVAYYNMDIMDAAGVDPASIETWDDFIEAGKQVKEKTGKYMCAVETSDLFFPQMMMLELKAQYVDKDGNPDLVTDAHVKVIEKIREMMKDGICEIAPGGGFHTEEWYGHLNGGNVACVLMPLWYMGRFTDYCPDLKQKMAIYQIPVWNKGDTREVLQGGTGTSVIKGTKNEQLAICREKGIKVIHCKKLYPFSTIKNQHNFDLIHSICFNRIYDLRDGAPEAYKGEWDRLEEMDEKAQRFFALELPVAWLPYEDWRDAKELANMAIMHRQDACIANGRPELVALCAE